MCSDHPLWGGWSPTWTTSMDQAEQFHLTRIDGWSAKAERIATLTVLYAVWVFANAWSINLVANGILALRLIPPNIPDFLVYAFAAALQSGAAFLALLTASFFRPFSVVKTISWLLVVAIAAISVAFEAWHACFVQMKNSIGAALERTERVEIQRINDQITNIGKQIPYVFSNKLKAFETLALDAATGRDRTGEARCGTICRENWDRYGKAKAGFSDLEINSVPDVGDSSDIRASFTDARYRFHNLRGAVVRLGDFYAALDRSAAPRSVVDAVAALGDQLSAKELRYQNLAGITETSLAMDATWQMFQQIGRGELPRRDAILPLAYGLLPFLCVLATSIYIRRVHADRNDGTDAGALERELDEEQHAHAVLRKLRSLREQNFDNWLAAHFRRRI